MTLDMDFLVDRTALIQELSFNPDLQMTERVRVKGELMRSSFKGKEWDRFLQLERVLRDNTKALWVYNFGAIRVYTNDGIVCEM